MGGIQEPPVRRQGQEERLLGVRRPVDEFEPTGFRIQLAGAKTSLAGIECRDEDQQLLCIRSWTGGRCEDTNGKRQHVSQHSCVIVDSCGNSRVRLRVDNAGDYSDQFAWRLYSGRTGPVLYALDRADSG